MTEQPDLSETQPQTAVTLPADASLEETSSGSDTRPPLPSMNLRGGLNSIGRSLVINGVVPALKRLKPVR